MTGIAGRVWRALVWRARRLLRTWGRSVAWVRTRVLGRPLILVDRRGLIYQLEHGEPFTDLVGVPRSRRELTDDPKVLAFVERILRPGDVVLDIGASIGAIALLAGRIVGEKGRVLAIEAEGVNFSQLSRNISLNQLISVEPMHLAVSDSIGSATLQLFERSKRGQHTLGRRESQGMTPVGSELVECTTIDALIERHGIDHVDLLKIDIEGAEPEAFAGAARSLASGSIHRIIFELSILPLQGMGHGIEDVIRPLRNAGYEIFSIRRDGTLAKQDPDAIMTRFANMVALAPGQYSSI